MIKELVPVVAACAMWGAQWESLCIQFHIDSMSVVDILHKDSTMQEALWCGNAPAKVLVLLCTLPILYLCMPQTRSA